MHHAPWSELARSVKKAREMTGGTNGTAIIFVDTKQWKRKAETGNVLMRNLVSEIRKFPSALLHLYCAYILVMRRHRRNCHPIHALLHSPLYR